MRFRSVRVGRMGKVGFSLLCLAVWGWRADFGDSLRLRSGV